MILQLVIGLCLVGSCDMMCVMLLEVYPESPATAIVADNLIKCLPGTLGAATIIQIKMMKMMGRGWCFTFVATVSMLVSPMLWIVIKQGAKWREATGEGREPRVPIRGVRAYSQCPQSNHSRPTLHSAYTQLTLLVSLARPPLPGPRRMKCMIMPIMTHEGLSTPRRARTVAQRSISPNFSYDRIGPHGAAFTQRIPSSAKCAGTWKCR